MADESLIRGAGLAAMSDSGIGGRLARSKAVSQIGQDMVQKGLDLYESKKLEKEKLEEDQEARGKEYDGYAQKILNNSELPQAEWDALYD